MKRVLLVLLLALSACSPPLDEGWVREMEFAPAHDVTWMMPIYSESCSGYGENRYCYDYVAFYVPITDHYPDAWKIRVEDVNRDEKQWITVTHEEYDALSVGDYWRRPAPTPQPGIPD